MVDARAAGLPLVALTNDLLDFHGQEWADAQDWLKHFDTVVDGSTTGVLKPDPGGLPARPSTRPACRPRRSSTSTTCR